jgi:hypothetical protein
VHNKSERNQGHDQVTKVGSVKRRLPPRELSSASQKAKEWISIPELTSMYLNSWPHLFDLPRLKPCGMLSRAETEFLRGEKQAKPQQLRYLKHCVRKKIRAFEENDLPAIMANELASAMFRSAIEANNGCAIE